MMNLLFGFLVASVVLASNPVQNAQSRTRRSLWWWANEPRFILGPRNGQHAEPNKALGVPSPHNYGDRVVLMDRNDNDRYQKFRLQDTSEGVYIRFDNHPQPGMRTRDGDNKVEMYNAAWDSHGEWLIIVDYIRQNNQWVRPDVPLEWTAEAMSKIGRMRVVVYNKGKDAFLRIKNGQPEVLKLDVENDKSNLKNDAWVKAQQLEWELVYVTNQWTAGAVTMMVLGPVAVITAVAGAAAAPAIAAAMFAQFGFAAIPAMNFLGAGVAAAMTATKWVSLTVISALIGKAVTGEEVEVGGTGEFLSLDFSDPLTFDLGDGLGMELHTYSIINQESFVMRYCVYGLALMGLIASVYIVYTLTCVRAKKYREINSGSLDMEI